MVHRISKILFSAACLALLAGCSGAPDPRTTALDPKLSPSPDRQGNPLDLIVFPDTAWGPSQLHMLALPQRFLTDWRRTIHLPAPPANSSARTRAEIAYLLDIQTRRTEADLALIRSEDSFEMMYAGRSLGPRFTQDNFPATYEMLRHASVDLATIKYHLKKDFARPRPVQLERLIQEAFSTPPHASYPSGHATVSFGHALLLGHLLPGRADRFLADARAVAQRRELAGFHYPSDTEAGYTLATRIVDELMENRGFQPYIGAARREMMVLEKDLSH